MRRSGHGRFDREGFGPGSRRDEFDRDGRHHRGGGGRRRMFEAGELRLVLLLLLEAEPRHGYDLIRAVETRTGGSYAPSPGIVYPTLTLLEELGQVAPVAAEGAKRLFAITDVGRQELASQLGAAEAAMARLDALGAERAPFDTGPVQRAMHNLGVALRQRLGGSPDRDTIFAVTDLLDEVARKIERL